MKLIIPGDCLERMQEIEAHSIDFIVTDPPYGLSFMGKDWDHGIPGIPFWQEALRICKPGSMLAAFGGTRTYHRLTCAIEDAGWEIRDCISWLYGSGFPKSHNHFGLPGYGTALKPAWEPIILAMKPLDGTYAQNTEKWGVAGININDCRIQAYDQDKLSKNWDRETITDIRSGNYGNGVASGIKLETKAKLGRWPANLILDEESAEMLDQQSDSGGASRFFYCAKASRAERGDFNKHPTVKPLALMQYIIKLLAPPGDPLLLDPFAGSGSTLVAAKQLGIRAIGIEKNPEYCEIAQKRVENAKFISTQLDMFA